MKDRIYTKRGDNGTTELLSGEVVSKNDYRIKLIGKLDYLNSLLGLACVADEDEVFYLEINGSFKDVLRNIQKNIFEISGCITTPDLIDSNVKYFDVDYMETTIDKIYKNNNQKYFMYPGINEMNARIHVARAYSREIERFISGTSFCSNEKIKIFFNRLSDYLYALSRFACFCNGDKEEEWKGKQ